MDRVAESRVEGMSVWLYVCVAVEAKRRHNIPRLSRCPWNLRDSIAAQAYRMWWPLLGERVDPHEQYAFSSSGRYR